MNGPDLLDLAKVIVSKDRRAAYGSPAESFGTLSDLWSAYLGFPVLPEQVVGCMMLLKLVRLKKNPHHLDSVTDIAGYAACYAEVIDER